MEENGQETRSEWEQDRKVTGKRRKGREGIGRLEEEGM
jgi:hypothetical protein